MEFTKKSDNSFLTKIPLSKKSFIEQFAQILTSEQSSIEDKFIGEINDNLIICKKQYIDESTIRFIVEVQATLVQNDENLIVETSLKPRRHKFNELSGYAQSMKSFYYACAIAIILLFVFSFILKMNYQYLLIPIISIVGYFLALLQVKYTYKKGIEKITEELKKEYELAYLRGRNT